MAVVLLGIVFGWFYNSLGAITIAAIITMISIIASFLFIIKQYERSVVLRLGKYNRQVSPGLHSRIPYFENVLVVDIREKVRELTAERMLTKDNVPVTIDAILGYKVVEDRQKIQY